MDAQQIAQRGTNIEYVSTNIGSEWGGVSERVSG